MTNSRQGRGDRCGRKGISDLPAAARRPTRASLARRDRGDAKGWRAYLFLLPSALILVVFVFYPIVESCWMSLHNWSFFLRAAHLSASQLPRPLGTTRVLERAAQHGSTSPSRWCRCRSAGAGAGHRAEPEHPGQQLFRSVFFFPVIASLATMGIVWKFLLDPQIGLIEPSHRPRLARSPSCRAPPGRCPAVMLVGVWKSVGFSMVIFLAALQDVPEALLGGGRARRRRPVGALLPGDAALLRPACCSPRHQHHRLACSCLTRSM